MITTNHKFRVFVSSTFLDLHSHRETVREIIRQLGADDVAMEHLGARDVRPTTECLRLVRDECDAFVGIYAHRYGHIPPRHRKSITELEYDAATRAGKKRLIYIIDSTAPWTPQFIDKGVPAARLKRFLESLKLCHVCKTFKNEHQLAAYVAADLAREFASIVYPHVDAHGSKFASQPKSVAEWNSGRAQVYRYAHNIFLAHTLTVANEPGQLYRVAIYLIPHRSNDPRYFRDDLHDVVRAEFFLGEYFGNQVFTVPNKGGTLGIVVSAFGPFLCLCRITFKDGTQTLIHRYIDFEMGPDLSLTGACT
jgi:hypothetical protein